MTDSTTDEPGKDDDSPYGDEPFPMELHGPIEHERPYLYWVCERLQEQAQDAAAIRERVENKGLVAFGSLAAVVAFGFGLDCPASYHAVVAIVGVAALAWSGWFLLRLIGPKWLNVADPIQYWSTYVRKAADYNRLSAIAFHVRARLEERLDLNLELRRSLVRVQCGAIVGMIVVVLTILLGGLFGGSTKRSCGCGCPTREGHVRSDQDPTGQAAAALERRSGDWPRSGDRFSSRDSGVQDASAAAHEAPCVVA